MVTGMGTLQMIQALQGLSQAQLALAFTCPGMATVQGAGCIAPGLTFLPLLKASSPAKSLVYLLGALNTCTAVLRPATRLPQTPAGSLSSAI